MDVISFLETTAEISVTFAGFISLFMVLARRDEPLAAEVATLIRFILIGTIASLFLAVVPLVAGAIGLAGAALWRTASAITLAASIAVARFAASQRRSLGSPEVTIYVRIAWILASLGLLLSTANLAGWPLAPNGGMHLAAIWSTLGIASVNLVDLVFRFALKAPPD